MISVNSKVKDIEEEMIFHGLGPLDLGKLLVLQGLFKESGGELEIVGFGPSARFTWGEAAQKGAGAE